MYLAYFSANNIAEKDHGSAKKDRALRQRRTTSKLPNELFNEFLLRKTNGGLTNVIHRQAWEETFRNWESTSPQLTNNPKNKTEDGQVEGFHRNVGKRRASHQNSDYELEDQINEWVNMTGFLCALGGVCLQKKSPCRPMSGILQHAEPRKGSAKQQESASLLANSSQEVQYCPVTQFMSHLLRLLIWNNEKYGAQIQKNVKELIAHEMSPALYPILFDQIKSIVEKFFDQQGQVIVSDVHTQFIEHTIFIMKTVLDSKFREPSEYLGITSIEGMTLAIVRYVRHLDMTVHAIHIKTKLCQLVEAMMKRRDDLAFRQEMKFRNKLVEYLTDWIMGTTPQITPPSNSDVATITRDLDQACMEAVGSLLLGLPLQPEESDRGDLMEAKSQLFLKYFTLFMNLLNDCNDVVTEEKKVVSRQHLTTGKLSTLRNATIQAMSNLLSANIDSGLMHSIGKILCHDIFVLTLGEHTSFSNQEHSGSI